MGEVRDPVADVPGEYRTRLIINIMVRIGYLPCLVQQMCIRHLLHKAQAIARVIDKNFFVSGYRRTKRSSGAAGSFIRHTYPTKYDCHGLAPTQNRRLMESLPHFRCCY